MMMRWVAPAPESRLVPQWLGPLLTTRFFSTCAAHADSPRSECNLFCLDCRAPPPAFCYYCRAQRHAAHRVVQIRRSSNHDVVRVSEVEDVLDITGVQTYVINSARVLFLNERPRPRGAGAAAGKTAASPYNCEICGRALLDPFRFCSIGCKLVGIKRSGGDAAFLAGGNEGGSDDGNDTGGGSKNVGYGGSSLGGGRQTPAKPAMRHPHRRKGIPRRAPFAS